MRQTGFYLLLLLGCFSARVFGQAVSVTVALDTNKVAVGGSTKLHVYAQIIPSLRTNTDRIFSWYLDVLNLNPAVASASYTQLTKPSSDKDPSLSSTGRVDGVNLRGVYDFFINLTNAGRLAPVELFSFPISANAAGSAIFTLQPGSTVTNLSSDFIVAPAGGGAPLLGGEYSQASARLDVFAPTNAPVSLKMAPVAGSNKSTLTFQTAAGQSFFLEYKDDLSTNVTWQTLPGSPFSLGSVTITNSGVARFFRLRITTP